MKLLRSGRPHGHRGRRMIFEPLESRLALSAEALASPVGDAQFLYYDDAVYGTLPADFRRPTPTVDPLGNPSPIDTPRFGGEAAYAVPLEWRQDLSFALPMGLNEIQASGWDADGVTPLMLVRAETRNQSYVYRGYDFERVQTIDWVETGLIQDRWLAHATTRRLRSYTMG